MSKLLTLLLCTSALAQLTGQRLRLEYFTVNDGLSSREINDFHVGDDGFLWVATMDGLNRFDGQQFTRFGQSTSEEGAGLSDKAINHISVDNEGRFILTFRNFYGYFDRYDPNTGAVEQVPLVPSTGVVGYPRAIVTDELGRTFVVSVGPEGTFVYEYTPKQTTSGKLFTALYHAPEDTWTTLAPRVNLLPLSNGQLLLYDEEHGFRYLSATGELLARPFEGTADQRRFYTFAEAADGAVYLSFRDGYPLFRWQPGPEAPPLPVARLDDGLRYPKVFKDEAGQLLLLATEDILGDAYAQEYYLVDTAGNFSLFDKPMPERRAITALAALNFNKTCYLGLREGLGVIERYANNVRTYLTARDGDKLGQNVLRGLCETPDGTVYTIEEEGNLFAFRPGAKMPDTLQLTLTTDTSKTATFRGGTGLLYDAKRHALWASARPFDRKRGGLLLHYDLRTGLTDVYPSKYALGAMTQDAVGRVYVAGSDARKVGMVLEFDRPTGSFQILPLRAKRGGVSGFKVTHLSWAKEGELLIGTEDRGFLTYNMEERTLVDYELTGELLGEEPVPAIYSVYQTKDITWVGTSNGLVGFPPGAPSRRYGRADGLSSNVIYGITPDTADGLWLSSQDGLTHLPGDFDPDNFRRYYREDGLANDEFSPGSALRASDGQYYFGGKNGLTVFTEADFSPQAAGADVIITEVSVYGRNKVRTINSKLEQLKQVTVFASEKSVAISFALPVGHLPSSTQFRYQLEGFNDDWVPLTNERTIRFNNLGAGKYSLRIQGAGANGNFGARETRLGINVRQYIYEQLWFQGFVVLSFAGLIFWILQARLRERLRNEKLRTQLSSDIHDEVSGLLAGITLQAQLLRHKTDDEKVQAKLDTMGEAGRTAMSKMSDVIWSIDSRRDTIGNLLQRMQEHADEVLLPIDIRYDFAAKGLDKERELAGNVRQDIYFIYKEAINNIAQHSNATRVDIEVLQAGPLFELYIRDNGSPPEPDSPGSLPTSPGTGGLAQQDVRQRVRKEKTGQGKDNMRMRAERLKGELTIDDRVGYTLVLRLKRL